MKTDIIATSEKRLLSVSDWRNPEAATIAAIEEDSATAVYLIEEDELVFADVKGASAISHLTGASPGSGT